jgi:hypothetical protein
MKVLNAILKENLKRGTGTEAAGEALAGLFAASDLRHQVWYMQLNCQEVELFLLLVSERYEHGKHLLVNSKYFKLGRTAQRHCDRQGPTRQFATNTPVTKSLSINYEEV